MCACVCVFVRVRKESERSSVKYFFLSFIYLINLKVLRVSNPFEIITKLYRLHEFDYILSSLAMHEMFIGICAISPRLWPIKVSVSVK